MDHLRFVSCATASHVWPRYFFPMPPQRNGFGYRGRNAPKFVRCSDLPRAASMYASQHTGSDKLDKITGIEVGRVFVQFFVLLQRQEGRMRPRWQLGAARGTLGELRVSDVLDEILRRRTLVARLLDIATPTRDLVPPLKDARLLYVDHLRMVLSGFEQIGERDFAQTWMLAVREDVLHALG
jgi:hypothetical protein